MGYSISISYDHSFRNIFLVQHFLLSLIVLHLMYFCFFWIRPRVSTNKQTLITNIKGKICTIYYEDSLSFQNKILCYIFYFLREKPVIFRWILSYIFVVLISFVSNLYLLLVVTTKSSFELYSFFYCIFAFNCIISILDNHSWQHYYLSRRLWPPRTTQ
jgi:hypothetical protein